MSGLQIAYIVMAGVGLLFLSITIFSGDFELEHDGIEIGHGDADSTASHGEIDSPSIFSLRTFATFLLVFGLTGIICIHNEIGIGGQLISGFISGIIIAFLYFVVMKFMYSMQGDSSVSSFDIIGKQGIVTTPSTSTGLAQIKVGNTEYLVRETNNKPLTHNEFVKIVKAEGGSLIVEKQ